MNRKTFAATATALTLSAGMLLSGAALAEQDFSKYTNEEMVQMRSQVRTMNEADRAQFQAEMQKRTRTMSASPFSGDKAESYVSSSRPICAANTTAAVR